MAFSETVRRRFADTVQAHLDDAYRLARRLVGASEAEDVVQDAALKALRALETHAVANPRAWFLAIVRNAAFDALAKRGPIAAPSFDWECAEREIMDPNADIEAAMIAKQDGAAVLAALDALPPPFREALTLRDVNDLSYREIAQATNAQIGTVMSRLARARSMLAKALGSWP